MDQLQILLHNITTLQYHPTDAHMSTSSLIPRHSGALLYEIAFKQIPTGLAKDIIALLSVLLFVSWIAVILRLLTRFYLVKIWWDDWFMLFTMVVFTSYCAMVFAFELICYNKSVLLSTSIDHMTNLLLSIDCVYIVAMVTLKISLGFFICRILPTQRQYHILWGTVAISTLMGIAYFFFALFQCGIPGVGDSFWLKRVSNRCIHARPGEVFGYTHAVVNTLTDLILSSLIIPLVWKAKINRKDKYVVSSIFVFANCTSIASLFRFKYVVTLGDATPNFFYRIQPIAIVSGVEMGIGIIAGSLVTLRPLLRKAKHAIVTTRSSRMKSSTTNKYLGISASTHFTSKDDTRDTNNKNFLLSRTKPGNTTMATFNDEKKDTRDINNRNFLLSGTRIGDTMMATFNDEKDDPLDTSIFNPTSPLSNEASNARLVPPPYRPRSRSITVTYDLHHTTSPISELDPEEFRARQHSLSSQEQSDWQALRRATWWEIPRSILHISEPQDVSTEAAATRGTSGMTRMRTESENSPETAVIPQRSQGWTIERIVP